MTTRMTLTFPDGSRVALPPAKDVYRVHPAFCSEFPGYGARPHDTRCIRCGREEHVSHRSNPFQCQRRCFCCGRGDHLGKVCPEMTEKVSRWWWRLRGITGNIPGLPNSPPQNLGLSNADVGFAPPAVLLEALRKHLAASDKQLEAWEESLEESQKMAETLTASANSILVVLGKILNTIPQPALSQKVIQYSAELGSISQAIARSTESTLDILAHRMRSAIQVHLARSGTLPEARALTSNSELNTNGKRSAARSPDRELGTSMEYAAPYHLLINEDSIESNIIPKKRVKIESNTNVPMMGLLGSSRHRAQQNEIVNHYQSPFPIHPDRLEMMDSEAQDATIIFESGSAEERERALDQLIEGERQKLQGNQTIVRPQGLCFGTDGAEGISRLFRRSTDFTSPRTPWEPQKQRRARNMNDLHSGRLTPPSFPMQKSGSEEGELMEKQHEYIKKEVE